MERTGEQKNLEKFRFLITEKFDPVSRKISELRCQGFELATGETDVEILTSVDAPAKVVLDLAKARMLLVLLVHCLADFSTDEPFLNHETIELLFSKIKRELFRLHKKFVESETSRRAPWQN